MRNFCILFSFALFLFCAVPASANIYDINVKAVPGFEELVPQYTYLYEKLPYYYQWSDQWKFPEPKQECVKKLTALYETLLKKEDLRKPNLELQLLLGDIAHFLYNLNEEKYFKTALNHYAKAEPINENDYRAVWFSAHHLAYSAKQKESMEKFRSIAESASPLSLSADFWDDYADAANLAFMPSNALMALNYARQIAGEPSAYDKRNGERIRKNIKVPEAGSLIEAKDQWVKVPDEERYINRPFGFRVDVDKGWKIQTLSGGKKQVSVSVLTAPAAKGKAGEVTYTYMLCSQIPAEGETLQSYIDSTLKVYRDFNPKEIKIKSPFPGAYAAEIIVPEQYKHEGGAHLVVYFFERNDPEYPDAKIEYPLVIPLDKNIQYYRQKAVYSRYKGRIFYLLVMDCCESVYKESSKNMEKLINKMIVVE